MTEEQFLEKLNVNGFVSHARRSKLCWLGNNYRIMPDEAFYFEKKIVLVEFESNKRLVESISKYWWLYKRTDWKKLNVLTELHFVVLNSHQSDIREESVIILGEELASQESYFSFLYHNSFL